MQRYYKKMKLHLLKLTREHSKCIFEAFCEIRWRVETHFEAHDIHPRIVL